MQETWKIGNAAPGNKAVAYPFKGMLSDVRLYSRVLTPMEVAMLAKASFEKLLPKDQPGAAHFFTVDETTHGNWRSAHGGAGYILINDSSQAPAFAQVIQSNTKMAIWSASTKDPRALIRASEADRFACAWYNDNPPVTVDINLTDGRAHRVALYCLDCRISYRAPRRSMSSTRSAAALSIRAIFPNMLKASTWSGTSKATSRFVCRPTSSNFVVSGIFFDQ